MSEPCRGRVAIRAADRGENVLQRASELSASLALPMCRDDEAARGFDLLLIVNDHRLELTEGHKSGEGAVYVDFCRGATGYRIRTSRAERQLIARAIGLRGTPPSVMDATAGLGRDAFLLAHLGCKVTAVERSPVLAELLRDGLARAAASTNRSIAAAAGNVTLVVGDSRSFLGAMSGEDAPDVVFIDPMYPPRGKSALAKKEMRICRRLVGDDADAAGLVSLAQTEAGKRVVVKRHRRAPPLTPNLSTSYPGRTIRYDVYLKPIR